MHLDDKPIVFAFHGYPWLVHGLMYRRTNHENMHVWAYKEEGTIIIDAMNAIFRKPEPYKKTSEAIIAASGNDHIVKCFNWIGAEKMDNPYYGNDVADMILCGNHSEDKKIVKQLAEDCGFRVFDIGNIEKEGITENAAVLWGSLTSGAGLGRNIAFKILKR